MCYLNIKKLCLLFSDVLLGMMRIFFFFIFVYYGDKYFGKCVEKCFIGLGVIIFLYFCKMLMNGGKGVNIIGNLLECKFSEIIVR